VSFLWARATGIPLFPAKHLRTRGDPERKLCDSPDLRRRIANLPKADCRSTNKARIPPAHSAFSQGCCTKTTLWPFGRKNSRVFRRNGASRRLPRTGQRGRTGVDRVARGGPGPTTPLTSRTHRTGPSAARAPVCAPASIRSACRFSRHCRLPIAGIIFPPRRDTPPVRDRA